jgi:murein L,D-transpeptidase YcbB/YkuD
MNVSAERRVEQIRANLERMRWAGSDLPRDFLLVDIAAQEVDLFRDGVSVWNSRVIVGRSERPTPVFRDRVEYLQFNPTWTVPPTILKEDILPKARRDPGAVRKKGLTVIDRDGNIVAPEEVDWNVSANNLPYTLRQPPGDRNALGQVKFMFPNRYSIYLHDTPDRRLFKRAKRTFSSGCVRVERPLELAELLLEDPDWNQERFASVLASEEPRTVRLPKSMPVILSYWTAEAGEDGEVRFREDIYARDERVLAALNGDGRVLLASAPVPASGAAPVSAAPEAAPRAEARAPENPQVEPPAQDPRRTGMAASSNEDANRIPPRRPSPAATSDRGGARVAEAAPEPRRKKRNWGTDLPGEGPLFEF